MGKGIGGRGAKEELSWIRRGSDVRIESGIPFSHFLVRYCQIICVWLALRTDKDEIVRKPRRLGGCWISPSIFIALRVSWTERN